MKGDEIVRPCDRHSNETVTLRKQVVQTSTTSGSSDTAETVCPSYMQVGRRDFFFFRALSSSFHIHSSSHLIYFLGFCVLLHDCCSHAQVFGKTLVHEFHISIEIRVVLAFSSKYFSVETNSAKLKLIVFSLEFTAPNAKQNSSPERSWLQVVFYIYGNRHKFGTRARVSFATVGQEDNTNKTGQCIWRRQ